MERMELIDDYEGELNSDTESNMVDDMDFKLDFWPGDTEGTG